MFARRLALLVLRDMKGRILLQRRSSKARTLPGYWAFFGGKIEAGESPENAVRREAKEELRLEVQDLALFKRYEFREAEGVYEKFVFVGLLKIPVAQLRRQQREGQDLGVFSSDETKTLTMTANDRVITRDLFRQS